MFSALKKHKDKMFSIWAFACVTSVAVMTSAITVNGWKITLEQTDKTAVDTAITGAISSYWDVFIMVLPYIAIFAVLWIAIWYFTWLVKFWRD